MHHSDGYRILIADDHPLFRDALKHALSGAFADVEILEAGTIEEMTERIEAESEIDLVLLDLAMPGVRGFSGLLFLRAQYPSVPVVVVSAHEEPAVVHRCLEFGASGFIPKSTDVDGIRQAVGEVLAGGVWTPPNLDFGPADEGEAQLSARLATLTPQQVRVLMMLSEGLLNKQIAYKLGVSEATVKAHVSAILQKLGVESRTQAVIAASRIEAGQWPGDPPA
ncbi:response regulator transcription factor [Microbaculum sp. FT89]|uniref:response regulator transcription factor n=1 Tax=Microbaculum sp. FT89 TaxID=3447298 RepID=UPI003F52F92C